MIINNKKTGYRFLVALAVIISLLITGFNSGAYAKETDSANAQTRTIRILGTSDLHGKFFPWDYALNSESTSGSMTQLASAVAEYRNENTLLFDAGDTIQDNVAELFFTNDLVHPMVQALNALNYDVCVTGNHEFNYGMDITKKYVNDLKAKVLVGNVYDEDGKPLADGYTILNKNGIRVAVIGMVTPNITHWDALNLAKCSVTDPLEETRKILEKIKGQYDLLVGVFHMGIDSEYDLKNSGVADILNACPEFDVMISAHTHTKIESMMINDVLVVQNLNQAQTMSVIDVTLEKNGNGWKVSDRTAKSVMISDYSPDPDMTELLKEYDEMARVDAEKFIGKLKMGALAPESEIADIPTAKIEDTALIDFINEVQMYYSGATVSAASLFVNDANLYPGKIKKCDVAHIYKYTNTLYKVHMNGRQLKMYMEWSAKYYNRYEPGDLTISFDPNVRGYCYDMFSGVNYEINLSKPVGERIENLTWPDGTPVKDDDEFDVAVNNYRVSTHLLSPGEIYEEDDLPKLLEIDIRGDIGGVRELLRDYIINVKGGVLRPECDHNWKITGNDWNQDQHDLAVKLIAEGKISVPRSDDGRDANAKAVTVDDVLLCLKNQILYVKTLLYYKGLIAA